MKPNFYQWIALILVIVCLPLSACSQVISAEAEAQKPLTIERMDNPDAPTVEKVSQDAAKRLDIQTAAAGEMNVNGKQQTVIPYTAILYDNQGNTWTYTNPNPLTYVRTRIKVDHIEGDHVILSENLPSGTKVVTVGGEELFGAEFEFQEE